MEDIVAVDEEMLGRIIGKKGKTKKLIEKMGNVKLKIKEGRVEVIGKNSLEIMAVKELLKAMNLGFSLEDATELLSGAQLMVLNLEEALPNKPAVRRQIARVIGHGGEAKRHFEKLLGIKIVVKGHKVAAIGAAEDLEVFKEALERLIHGATHTSVFRYIQRRLASRRLDRSREALKNF